MITFPDWTREATPLPTTTTRRWEIEDQLIAEGHTPDQAERIARDRLHAEAMKTLTRKRPKPKPAEPDDYDPFVLTGPAGY